MNWKRFGVGLALIGIAALVIWYSVFAWISSPILIVVVCGYIAVGLGCLLILMGILVWMKKIELQGD